ncbi:MAG: DUF4886 domain-containing protein [Gammaproteobacteria bacterium]|nr:hypothetical protein [Gammaproteobacteria bacterium]RPG40049.1 MAG: hypothetical protein CBD96_003510 [Gammaproteobacteria bacterium TMED236]|tara:strand:- start:71 stop:850 length:780 start_codon:yes stop_codon:yes gene_type:complete
MKHFLIYFFIATNLLLASDTQVYSLINKTPERVLYIGNSYLYYNDSLHNHVRRMFEEIHSNEIDTSNYKSVTISGSRSWHHNVDYMLNHKNIGADQPFQLVIFQGGSGEANTKLERKIFSNEVEKVVDKIHKSGAEAALYMIHAFVEPHDQAHPTMIEDIKKMYIDAGIKNNALVIPVGIAFENAYKIKPNIKLHKSFDGSHPSMLGTYLASCVVFASITQKTPKGLHYNYFNKISDADKNFLQDIAHMTVESFFDLEL